MSAASQIQTGLTNITGLLAAAPQIAGLFNPATTIGYQPQATGSLPLGATPAANILNNTTSIINSLFPNSAPTLLFQYEGEQKVTSDSDITDHWIENNSPLQDHIALKPIILNTTGFIGELTDAPPNSALKASQVTAQTLQLVAGYAPGLSATATQAYNQAFALYQTTTNAAAAAQSAWGTINGKTGQTVVGVNGTISSLGSAQNKQQIMYQQLLAYQQGRVLFTCQTPWAVFQSCAIQNISAVQGEDTMTVSSFNVTFKQIRYITDLQSTGSSTTGTGRLSAQAQTVQGQGSSTGVPAPITFATAFGSLSGSGN